MRHDRTVYPPKQTNRGGVVREAGGGYLNYVGKERKRGGRKDFGSFDLQRNDYDADKYRDHYLVGTDDNDKLDHLFQGIMMVPTRTTRML